LERGNDVESGATLSIWWWSPFRSFHAGWVLTRQRLLLQRQKFFGAREAHIDELYYPARGAPVVFMRRVPGLLDRVAGPMYNLSPFRFGGPA